ncbi:MAG: hypothetical protein JF567_09630 [Xanthomonadales bacterium]|nr:hypothetical protein [Xanthomonadales bacterium]
MTMKLSFMTLPGSLSRIGNLGTRAPAAAVAPSGACPSPAPAPRPKLPPAPVRVEPIEQDPDDEVRGNSEAARARRRERARCGAIFACAAAGENIQLAAELAFNSGLTRQEAIARLQASSMKASRQQVQDSWAQAALAVTGRGRAIHHHGAAPGEANVKGNGSPIQTSWAAAFEACARGGRRPVDAPSASAGQSVAPPKGRRQQIAESWDLACRASQQPRRHQGADDDPRD